MKFFNIDQHISVISDIKHFLNIYGHTVRSFNQSGHCNVVGIPQVVYPELKGDNWCTMFNKGLQKEFWHKYAVMTESFDGFIATYPPIYSTLYKYSKKPIIIDIAIRYEYGADGDPALWEEFSEYLRQGVDDGRIFLVANNMVDKLYTQDCLDREVTYIPSICNYTGITYNPVQTKWLVYSNNTIEIKHDRMVRKHDMLQAGHAWQMVGEFQGCIHFPYQVSTMSIFEQYSAGIPMAFPTKRFMLELYSAENNIVLDQISHARQSRRKGTPIYHHQKYDLNQWDDIENIAYWMNYADFYNKDMFPHLLYFDNTDELNAIANIPTDELIGISKKMLRHTYTHNYGYAKAMWGRVLDKLSLYNDMRSK